MFKDARLQERIFDQIHAVEFNMEDDFRHGGSWIVASRVDSATTSFERVDDDGESDAANRFREGQRPREAHVSSFVDDVRANSVDSGGFERISDDEEEAVQRHP